MNNLFTKLEKDYAGYRFSSGSYTGSDYTKFQTRFINALRKTCNSIDAKLVSTMKGHYILSAFIERDGKYVYLSLSDVRFRQDGWINDLLVRTAQNEKDYTGGYNNRATIYNLEEKIEALLSK